jgi:hypothetical protein
MAKWQDYAAMKLDPRWQRRRLEIMQRANFACEICKDEKTTLEIHHRIYRRGHAFWEYGDHELSCVCSPCHAQLTAAVDRLKEACISLDANFLLEVAGYARGLALERRILFDEQPALTPGFLFDSADWCGIANALGLDTHSDLCSADTTEADLVAAYKAARALKRSGG